MDSLLYLPLLLFYGYLLLSVCWAHSPFVSLRRWGKEAGNILIVLLILSEAAIGAGLVLFGLVAVAPRARAEDAEKKRYVVAAIGDSMTDFKVHGGRYLKSLREKCPDSVFDSYGKGGQMVNQMRKRFVRDVFGADNGVGARSAVGMGSLPGDISVEIEAIFEVEDLGGA